MRFFWIVLFWICFGFVDIYGASVLCVTSTMTKLYSQNDFTRISEYLTGCENTDGDYVFRTDEDCRGGMYVVLKLNKSLRCLGEGARLKFGYVLSDSAKTHYKEFVIPGYKSGSRWVYIGITGKDWGCSDLVAWSVDMEGALTSVKKGSYLWEFGG